MDSFFQGQIMRQTRAEFSPSISKGSRGFEFPSLRHTVCRCCLQFRGRRELRAEAGVHCAGSAPEKAGLCRILALRPGFSPHETKTVRFAAAGRIFAWASPLSPQARDFNWSAVKRVQLEVFTDTEDIALRRPFQRQVDAVEQGLGAELGGLLPVADRFHDGGCDEGQA